MSKEDLEKSMHGNRESGYDLNHKSIRRLLLIAIVNTRINNYIHPILMKMSDCVDLVEDHAEVGPWDGWKINAQVDEGWKLP